MANSITGVEAYARTHPMRDGGSWAGWCASFVYRAGGFSRSFESALIAGNNAGPLNPYWREAPRGAIHYWAGVGDLGHCAFELGNGILLMASNAVTSRWGTAMGTVSFTEYARLGIPYRGWSMRWGNETLAGSSTSGGGGYTPIEEDNFMTDMNEYLNSTAFTGGPSISVIFLEIHQVYNALFHGGPSMEDAGNPIQRSLAQINSKVHEPVDVELEIDENLLAKNIAEFVLAGLPEGTVTKKDIADAMHEVLGSIKFGAE